MKKGYILLLAVMFASLVFGQSKQKVAVYVTGDADAGTKKVIGAKMVSAITNNDGYAAVERTSDFLAELSKEQNYQMSGAVADNQIVALGKQFGVRFVCVADISSIYGSTFVSARMINVETAIVTATADRDKEINGMADLTELAEEVADGLLNSTAPCNKKDKPIDRKGCCEGLVAVNGICVDAHEKCKKEKKFDYYDGKIDYYEFSPDNIHQIPKNIPNGWRLPTEEELEYLNKLNVLNRRYYWTKEIGYNDNPGKLWRFYFDTQNKIKGRAMSCCYPGYRWDGSQYAPIDGTAFIFVKDVD